MMLAAGTNVFLMIPGAGKKRVFHPGKVLESDSMTYVAEFEQQLALRPQMDVVAFGDVNGKFFQQGALVVEVRRMDAHPVAAFARVGEAVSAEQRQTFRVSVVNSAIVARIGSEDRCAVVDISPEGFGVVVKRELKIGSIVQASFEYDRQKIATTARVQTVQIRPDGRVRYGLLAPEKNSPARNSLQKMTGTIQRLQLQRLAGAA